MSNHLSALADEVRTPDGGSLTNRLLLVIAEQGERHTALLAEIRDALRALAKDRAHRGG